MDNNIGSKREQFDSEAAEIRGIIYSLINDGNLDVAKQVLEQYLLINPMDPEIGNMKNLIYTEGSDTKANDFEVPEEYGILNGIETIFVLAGIIFKRVGSIDSALRKIKLMEDRWGYRPLILTCIHNIENRQARTWLETAFGDDQITLNPGTRMINVYEHFQKSYAEGLENIAVYTRADDGTRYVEKAENVYEVYDENKLVRKEYYNGYAGSLRMKSFYDDDGNRCMDMIYDDWGYLNYTREYNTDINDLQGEKYYTTDGDLCLESFYRQTKDGKDHIMEKLIHYDSQGNIIGEYESSADLAAVYLDQIMRNDKFYILMVEDGLMSTAATKLNPERKNVAKCEIVHNIFLSDAYDLKSEPQKYYDYLCRNHQKFDGIVMLTQDAKNDFQKLYGNPEKVFVIPHPYPYDIHKVDYETRDNRKVVIVSRLNHTKMVDVSVDIFAMVLKAVPDLKLEIYGRGDEEEKLRKQIKKLGIENSAFLMGYTDDPLSTFKGAAMFMMTSWAEGFGMTLMESICNGCPAFAFDIKYGPSEIIIDGQTGFLVPRFNKEIFAKKMIEFFSNEDLQREMSENCYADVGRFSTDKFMENWFDMTETLYKRHGDK